jgi:hypothetical protein
MKGSRFVRQGKIARGFAACAVAACMVLLLLPVMGADSSVVVGGEANAAGIVEGSLLGLDVRDYATNMAVRVPLAERQQIKHYKVVVSWNRIEAADGVFDWSYYDTHISQMLADGAESILLLMGGGVPAWAKDPVYGDLAVKAPPRDLSKWYRFCGKVAERYGHLVDFYEIWNEPGWDRDSAVQQMHGVVHFGGQVETEYLPLLQLGHAAVKENDPTGQVICGALLYGTDPAPTAGTELYSMLYDDLNRPGQDVSISVTSSREIVAERPMYFNYKSAWPGGHDVLGATAASNEWFFAEGTTRGNFDEWLCLQNPNPAPITVDVTFMFGPGQGANSVKTYDLQANSRTTLLVDNEVGEEKDVSMKLTSASDFIAERPMYFSYGSGWMGGHDVVGATATGKEWFFAEGTTRGNFDEWLCLQNPNPAPITVSVTFMFGPGQGDNQTIAYSIDPNSRKTIKVDDEVGEEKDVSMKLTSASDFIAERPMYFSYGGGWTGGHDVVGATAASNEWYFAEGTTRGNFDEWLCLQNPNPTAITVSVTFMFGPGQGDNQTIAYSIDPNSRKTIKVDDEVGEEKDVSMKLTSASDFIAERPMYFSYGSGWTGGHDVVGAAAPSTQWYFAEGCTGYSIQEYLCLQNPHDEAVAADITFMMTKGEVFTRKVSLPARSRTTLDINRFIGFNGSSDMVAAHPYRAPADWGAHYAAVVQALRAKGSGHEVVCTEIGWPHYSDDHPEAYSEANQAEDLGARGVGGLFSSGCKKIWIYRGLDEPPGTSWDKCYYGLFDYLGNPFAAWSSYKNWQSQLPDYPKLPGSI